MTNGEEEIREALGEVLSLYDIKVDELSMEEETSEIEPQEDYSDLINKTQEKLDELNEKAEEIYERTGMSREQLESYSANPNNFSPEQWEALQKVREACENYKTRAAGRLKNFHFEEKIEKRIKKQKQPQRFAKKKHWIPL
ncbi:MAG: hypothetical protein K940chlam9_01263 [Chlamydiae bacterium]|nr:hypothetical protein [Chlamydiota bacterium]